jgi:predicted DNA-binding transcriptional regulator YafY
MSKRGYISRYLLILKKLKLKSYTSYEELEKYIYNQAEYLQSNDDTLLIGFSKRTLQRDLKDVRNLFGTDIAYSKQHKGYYIVQNEMENISFQRMMEAFELFNSLNISQEIASFIHLDQRKPQGSESLYGVLHAIKNHIKIRFAYQKFWDDKPNERIVAPYAIKEFKNRWYILAKDDRNEQIKTFALDRLSEMEITNQKFKLPHDYDPENIYRHSFGIMAPNGDQPEEIILSFEPHQGKYIKTLPLHHTQQVIVDNEDELQVKLDLYITEDFIMELLSFGENVKILHPQSLVNAMIETHKNALAQY